MSSRADVVVVGGGVIGCAAAWFLVREGLSVCLLERDGLASEASGAAAGMLLPYGESSAPGVFYEWGRRSLALLPELCAELHERSGIDPELEECGALYVALDAAGERALAEKRAALVGAPLERLDARAARDASPGLAPGVRAALWSPSEGHVRSPLLTRAYAEAAQALGMRVERGVVATSLRREAGRCVGVETSRGPIDAGAVVLCGGAWAPELAPCALPIEPVRGQIVSLENPTPPLRTLVLEGPTYLVPKRDGSLVVGATEEQAGFDRRVTPEGVSGLLSAASRLVPGLARTGFRGAWAGLRPATPDRLPAIGPAPGEPGVFVAAGHFRNGVLLSALTGQLIASQLLGKSTPLAAEAFLPGRFERP